MPVWPGRSSKLLNTTCLRPGRLQAAGSGARRAGPAQRRGATNPTDFPRLHRSRPRRLERAGLPRRTRIQQFSRSACGVLAIPEINNGGSSHLRTSRVIRSRSATRKNFSRCVERFRATSELPVRVPASQQLFHRDRQLAHPLAGRVIDGVRDGRCNGNRGQFA
jgi:hypothetical protein